MDIRQKLSQVQQVISDDQKEERKIINSLMFLMFETDSDELPAEFEIECIMDNEAVETFLREKLELDVKAVSLVPLSFMFGSPKFRVELN